MKTMRLRRVIGVLLVIAVTVGLFPVTAQATVGTISFSGLVDRGSYPGDSSLSVKWSGSSGQSAYYQVAIKALAGEPDKGNVNESGDIIGGYNGIFITSKSVKISASSLPDVGTWIKIYVKGFASDKWTATDEACVIYVEIGEITVSKATLSATATKSQYTLKVTSTVDWKADTNVNWISVSPSSGGSGSTTITVSVDANTSSLSREGEVWIDLDKSKKKGEIYSDVIVTQAAGSSQPGTTVSPTTISAKKQRRLMR